MGDLSKHFSKHEFRCKCGKGHDFFVPLSLITCLELLHAILAYEHGSMVKIKITSGHRCPEHNQNVGGSPTSHHLAAMAADIKAYVLESGDWLQIPPEQVSAYIDEIFPNTLGIGIYKTFTHIDIRQQRARWRL